LTVPTSRDLAPNTPRSAELEADALRLYRRICVLRAKGETIAADHLESGEFARVRSAAAAASPSRDEQGWEDRLTAERRRIDDAQLLAELLVPLLAERLADALAANLALSGETGFGVGAEAVAARKAKAGRNRATPSGPLEIADFIEGMLAQERDEVRQRAARQAS
jgi:hypothetical protein